MKRLDFSGIAPNADAAAALRVGPLVVTVATKHGERRLDFTELRGTRLERDVVLAFQEKMGQLRVTGGDVLRIRRCLLAFFAHLSKHHPAITAPRHVTAAVLDEWVMIVMPQGPASGWTAYDTCMDVFAVLKELPEDQLEGGARQRLVFVHPDGTPPRTPRDAYSDYVVEQLVRACRQRIPQIVQRLTSEATALVARGVDPRADPRGPGEARAWAPLANRVWLADRTGPLRLAQIGSGLRQRMQRIPDCAPLAEVNRALFPTADDLTPFFVLLALETSWPPAMLLELTTSCRTNLTKDHVTLTAIKYRAGHMRLSEKFKASGFFTPGGLVAQLLAITERLRRTSGGDRLFLTFVDNDMEPVTPKFRASPDESLGRFLRAAGIVDDEQQPLPSLEMSRIRKSAKKRWYKQTQGVIARFARDEHSHRVAAENYGNIPDLADTHDRTVADGQRAALQAVLRPSVTAATDPSQIAEELEISVAEAGALAAGARDMWVSGCRDPLDSPFARKGELCGARPGRCLECKNAVILSRHLPRVLAYRHWLQTERTEMSLADWNGLHGTAYLHIEHGILPRFPAAIVAQAAAVAHINEGLPLLPPQLILEGVV